MAGLTRRAVTLELSGAEALSLEVVLDSYLSGFTVAAITRAHEDSALRRNLRVWNQLRNASLGNAQEWRLDRLPARLGGE